MTLEQLEHKIQNLERQIAELRLIVKPLAPVTNVQATFGMFANDAEFEEIVRLGKEYRDQVNAEVD